MLGYNIYKYTENCFGFHNKQERFERCESSPGHKTGLEASLVKEAGYAGCIPNASHLDMMCTTQCVESIISLALQCTRVKRRTSFGTQLSHCWLAS